MLVVMLGIAALACAAAGGPPARAGSTQPRRTCERNRPRREPVPRGRQGPRRHPHLQRGRQPAARSWTGSARAAPAVGRAHRRRRQPRRHRRASPTSSPPADPAVHVLHRAGQAGARRRVHGRVRVGAPNTATTRSWRWTPTAPTPRRSCRGCWTRSARPTSCSAPGTCRAARVSDWPFHRQLLSRSGNLYMRMALGMPFRDATGGYRAYRIPVLSKIELESIASQGYCFQVDLAVAVVPRRVPGRRRCRSRSPSGSAGTRR